MKISLFTVLLIAMMAGACTGGRKLSKQEANLEGSWVLSVYMPAQKKTLSEVFGTHVAELHFDKTNNTVSGSTGCNRFSGTYTADTTHLSFSQNRATTKMACPDYDETLFINAMNRINKYRLIEGQLELMQEDEIVMIFAKKI